MTSPVVGRRAFSVPFWVPQALKNTEAQDGRGVVTSLEIHCELYTDPRPPSGPCYEGVTLYAYVKRYVDPQGIYMYNHSYGLLTYVGLVDRSFWGADHLSADHLGPIGPHLAHGAQEVRRSDWRNTAGVRSSRPGLTGRDWSIRVYLGPVDDDASVAGLVQRIVTIVY